MIQLLAKTSGYIDAFTDGFGKRISWLIVLMAILMFSVVVFRYGLNLGSIALQESVLYLHALVFMGASAFTLKNDGHVRVDVLYRKMSLRAKAWVDLSGTLLFLFPVCLFITFISIRYVSSSWGNAGNIHGARRFAGCIFIKIPYFASLWNTSAARPVRNY